MDIITSLNQDAIAKYAKGKLSYIAEKIPDGNFWNLYGYPDHCDGIAVTVRGDVVALYPRCSLSAFTVLNTPIEHDGVTYTVALHQESCGGTIDKCGTWEHTIHKYNEHCAIHGSAGSAILAYTMF